MPRVVIGPAVPDRALLDNEIARLRGLDVGQLRARWHTVFRRRAPPHLPCHLLFRILAYRLQAERLADLDAGTRRLLDRIGSGSLDETDRLVADLHRSRTEVEARHPAYARVGWPLATGHSAPLRVFLERQNLPKPVQGGFGDHRLALEWPQVFRPAR